MPVRCERQIVRGEFTPSLTAAILAQENAQERLATFIETLGVDQTVHVGAQNGARA